MNTCERSRATKPCGARAAKCRMVTWLAGSRTTEREPINNGARHLCGAQPLRVEWGLWSPGVWGSCAMAISHSQVPQTAGRRSRHEAVRGVRGVFPLRCVAPADKQWGTAFMRCPTALSVMGALEHWFLGVLCYG